MRKISPSSGKKRDWWPDARGSVIAGVLALAVLGLGRVFPGSELLQTIIWPCPLKMMAGIPCLACGSTRVSVMLAHGDILGAFALAPLPALVLTVMLTFGVVGLFCGVTGRRGPDWVMNRLLTKTPGRMFLVCGSLALWAYALLRSLETGAP